MNCKSCTKQCEYHKCETCRYYRYESDGGDGHPAEYCTKGHWGGFHPDEHDFERKCEDFERRTK